MKTSCIASYAFASANAVYRYATLKHCEENYLKFHLLCIAWEKFRSVPEIRTTGTPFLLETLLHNAIHKLRRLSALPSPFSSSEDFAAAWPSLPSL